MSDATTPTTTESSGGLGQLVLPTPAQVSARELPARKLAFTQDIERQALRIVSKDPNFVLYWNGRLKAEHFGHAYNKMVFRVVELFVKQYGSLPTQEIIIQEATKSLSPDDAEQTFVQYVGDLLNEPDKHAGEYIKNQLMEHMRAEDFKYFLVTCAQHVRDGKYDDVSKLLSEVTKRHIVTPNTPVYLATGESVAERVALENLQRAANPSPWPTLNANHGGGFQISAVTAFMGPTGSGKSILLVNAGAGLMLAKKVVYHFTFELSRMKTMARYDVVLTGVKSAERRSNPRAIDEALDKLKANGMGALYVIEMPTGTCSTNKVRSTIDDYVSRGCPPPDIVVLDYMTIMTPNNPESVDMKKDYAKLKVIAEEIRALAMERQFSILTALQSNRGAAGKEKISKEDIADSYAVMHVLDLVLSINQTDAEKEGGRMRLYTAKVRDFADSYFITADINYDNLRVVEDTAVTNKYQKAFQKVRDDAVMNAGTVNVSEAVDPSSVSMGMENLIGIGHRPSTKTVVAASAADIAEAENRLSASGIVTANSRSMAVPVAIGASGNTPAVPPPVA